MCEQLLALERVFSSYVVVSFCVDNAVVIVWFFLSSFFSLLASSGFVEFSGVVEIPSVIGLYGI